LPNGRRSEKIEAEADFFGPDGKIRRNIHRYPSIFRGILLEEAKKDANKSVFAAGESFGNSSLKQVLGAK